MSPGVVRPRGGGALAGGFRAQRAEHRGFPRAREADEREHRVAPRRGPSRGGGGARARGRPRRRPPTRLRPRGTPTRRAGRDTPPSRRGRVRGHASETRGPTTPRLPSRLLVFRAAAGRDEGRSSHPTRGVARSEGGSNDGRARDARREGSRAQRDARSRGHAPAPASRPRARLDPPDPSLDAARRRGAEANLASGSFRGDARARRPRRREGSVARGFARDRPADRRRPRRGRAPRGRPHRTRRRPPPRRARGGARSPPRAPTPTTRAVDREASPRGSTPREKKRNAIIPPRPAREPRTPAKARSRANPTARAPRPPPPPSPRPRPPAARSRPRARARAPPPTRATAAPVRLPTTRLPRAGGRITSASTRSPTTPRVLSRRATGRRITNSNAPSLSF